MDRETLCWVGGNACGLFIGAFGGALYGATNRWGSLWGQEALHWVCGTHAGGPTGTSGVAPHGATERCIGCAGRMWAVPLGPS
eukprot:5042607-Pyramimonas_sp.AAC.1